ncbi:ABC transporter ATP-binding protein [Chitinophaga horti]|uniref:ABC transporter ATP-binding protein n=1 Tax=Chitinophaga horti TaxID=2920382 RepID=A0ABY6J427_9BACT|nr:ABC transporter ATP-binding protein [Chitinophaga horti]UYQ94377.1 ABC transporter ATP-binding protein [Chitinophaga horti]
MEAIVIHHIIKQFGDVTALNDVSFTVNEGELFGLIGPDGAGKSTLFRILTTLLVADKGSASVMGLDIVKDYKTIRRSVGYMPGRFSLYPDLSTEENLRFFATIFNTTVEANYDLIRDIYVQIEPFKKRPAGKLSGGMKQKLALCCALIHKPAVLFLDEPTTGVDPVSRKEFWEMLQRLKERGIAILVSTPYMDEAVLCNRVALMQKGRLMDIDTPQDIVDRFQQPLWAVSAADRYALMEQLRQYDDVASSYAFGEHLHVTLKSGEAGEERLRGRLSGFNDLQLFRTRAGIEDCFMFLMQEQHQ